MIQNNKRLLYALIIVISASCFISSLFSKADSKLSNLVKSNIEVLTQNENNINLVPDRYLEAKIEFVVVTCNKNGSLTIGSNIIKGDYSQGASYSVVIEIKNCSGEQNGSFCDQSQVGVKIVG